MIGRTLSHYEIAAKLGAGGMGEVYLARDLTLERQVALKVLPEDVAEDATLLKRLQREAKALAALDHPNIVTVFSVEEDQGVHFLTMGYVEGRTLNELIPSGGMPVEELLEHAVALADALRAAHERGIIHRDMKPSNVMVDGEGRLRVLDFGLARRDETVPLPGDQPTQKVDDLVTSRGVVMGTIPYMSPEQAEGKLLDARSDLFSLGTMLYEMATGSRPFAGETPASLISSILRDTPSSVTAVRPPLPEPLGPIIERCIEKAPEDRYQSAKELRDELVSLRTDVLSGSVTASSGETAPRRPGMMFAAAVLVIVIAVAGTMIWRSDGPHAAADPEAGQAAPVIRSIVVLPLRNLSGDPEQEYFADGMTEDLITDLSKIGELRVISRTSAMRYKNTEKTLPEIAAELNVDAVIDGSIAREGERVRVTAQLIHAETDRNLWAERYERDISSVMAMQSDLARAIASEVKVTLTPAEERRLTADRPIDPAAYDAYLKGIFHRNQFTPQDLATALDYFSSALERDPDFAAAYVGAASIWAYRMVLGLVPNEEACRNWKVAISGGLARDDLISEAHVGLAQIRFSCDWDWAAADEEYRRAIEVNPGNAEAHMFYGNFLGAQHRHEEAEREIRLALELDPMNGFYWAGHGVQLSFKEDFRGAIEKFERSLEISPGGGFAHFPYSRALYRTGNEEKAAAEAALHLTMLGEDDAARALREGTAAHGYEYGAAQAASILAEGSVVATTRPMFLVQFFDDAGDVENAVAWLPRAREIRDLDMAYLSVLDLSDELRADPRYTSLLNELELPVRR